MPHIFPNALLCLKLPLISYTIHVLNKLTVGIIYGVNQDHYYKLLEFARRLSKPLRATVDFKSYTSGANVTEGF